MIPSIGILQGRLTPSVNGKLQCFPYGRWEEEFGWAGGCGLDAIELLYEPEPNPENPLQTSEGFGRLRRVIDRTGVRVGSICMDYLMRFPLHREGTASMAKEAILTAVAKAKSLAAHSLVLPFFEEAEIQGPQQLERLADALEPCLEQALRQGVQLALETTLEGASLLPFLEAMGHPALKVCYDLGNTTALGHDLPKDIRVLGRWIAHVHVKDRKRDGGPNVLLGTGDTDFQKAFAALRDVHYSGPYILESNRGDDPVATARNHLEFVRSMLEDRRPLEIKA